MFGLGIPELIVILIIALLVFGPGKLPDVGKFLGKGLRDFRDALERKGEDEGQPPAVKHHDADDDGPPPPPGEGPAR
ncbi:MAG TPA: twin-arginine translocase TatA/TatE family subunit [Candidatus Binatia bacterium]|nr:twin-arginine translocase TatA/TatE family subunit [Candidatus Binatia bacterium]